MIKIISTKTTVNSVKVKNWLKYVSIIRGWSDGGMKYMDGTQKFFFFNIQDFSSLLEMASFLFVIQIALQGGSLSPPLDP